MGHLSHWSKVFLFAVIIFFILDMLWLGVIAKNYYRQQLGHLLLDDFNWIAASIFYFIFLIGMMYFVVSGLPVESTFAQVLLRSMLFGLITYATYDLTNMATLKNWPITLSLVDMAWGSILSGVVGSLSFYFHRWLMS